MSIGCGYVQVDVTLRVVDGETGQPLTDAVVAIASSEYAYESERFESELEGALNAEEHEQTSYLVAATRLRGAQSVALQSHVAASSSYMWGIAIRSSHGRPALVIVDHPKHGRVVVPIDADVPMVETDGAWGTYTMDLGTIRVPPR